MGLSINRAEADKEERSVMRAKGDIRTSGGAALQQQGGVRG